MRWLFLCFICLGCQAQNAQSGMLECHGGINITAVRTATSTNGLGFSLSVFRSWQSSRRDIQLLTGLEFIQTGQRRVIHDGSGLLNDENIRLSNISLPIFVRYQAGRDLKVCTEFGLYASLIMAATSRDNFSQQSGTIPTKSLDLGPHIAIGLVYPDENVVYFLRLSSHYGLANLQVSEYPKNQPKLYNRYWMLSFGIGF